MANGEQQQFVFSALSAVVVPHGDGSYTVKPGKPVVRLSLREAAKRTGLSRTTIYRLWDAGLVKGERPSPRKIYVFAESLEMHLRNSQDPEFWLQPEAAACREKFSAV